MSVAQQKAFSLVNRAHLKPVSQEIVEAQPNLLAAIRLCVQSSGLEDKAVYMGLGLDQAQWSRILKGDMHFPPNKLCDLMDICGNESPLEWLAYSRGKGLVMLKSEAEKRADDLQKKLDEAELENRVLMKALGARK